MFAYAPSIITILVGLVLGAFALTKIRRASSRIVPLLAVIGVMAVGLGWLLQTTVSRHADTPAVAQLYPESLRMALLVGGGLLAVVMALIVFVAYYALLNKTRPSAPAPSQAPASEPDPTEVSV